MKNVMNRNQPLTVQALTLMVAIATVALTTSAFAQTSPLTGASETQPTVQPSPGAASSTTPSTPPPTTTPSEPLTPEPPTAAPTLANNCDAAAQICFDDRGISVELTRQYFGNAAASSLQQGLR